MQAFREVQYVRQNRLFNIIWIPTAIMWVLFVQQVLLGQVVGNNPAPDWFVIILWVLVGLGLPYLWWTARLIVEVDNQQIQVRYTPFVNKQVAMADITAVEETMYSALSGFGGWGIRFRPDGTRAYTVAGNNGVTLTLIDGKQLLLGSQQDRQLANAIRARMVS